MKFGSASARMKLAHAGASFIHESFNQHNPTQFTRPWFASVNSYFGELIVRLSNERPAVFERTEESGGARSAMEQPAKGSAFRRRARRPSS
jgi:hypothetical protein